MRLIHEVIEDLRGRHDEEVTPMGAALIELLGGERGSLPEQKVRFTDAGRRQIIHPWIGDGPNLSISTRDLRRILGEQRAEELATLAGVPSGEFLVRLAHLLLDAGHRMTPEGVVH